MSPTTTASTPAESQPRPKHNLKIEHRVTAVMNFIVLALSVLLIVWISIDTFEKENFLQNHIYMQFQFWVCMVFILDFFVGLWYAEDRWRFFRHRLVFLLLSIPYLNIINQTDIQLDPSELYFLRFVPLGRGALAVSIVVGYLSSNAISSLFMSYIVILIMLAYFCSLIFFQREHAINPQIDTYWTALWWTMMNLSTVGCYINPMTIAGKIIAVVLPISGMIIFPLFTVYLTNYVTGTLAKNKDSRDKKTE